MIEKIAHKKKILIVFHILIGFLATLPWFPKIYGLLILIIPSVLIIYNKNKNEEALIFSSYIVGAEVFVRMIGGFTFYESGKYAVILFLVLGFLLGSFKQKFSFSFLTYILLLLLGIVFTQVPEGESIRKSIIFNLSGPLVLGAAALYFYYRKITKKELTTALFFMLLPLISMVVYLYFRTPNINEIVFGGAANFDTSGGFGPNQVATAIGLGIFIIAILILLKERISGLLIIDAFLLIYFVYRGLLTFSRGGIITGIVALVIFFLFYILYQKQSLQMFLKYIVIGALFTIGTWLYTSNITGGMLDNRYTGKNARGVQKEDISSGRVAIFQKQLENFIKTPLGIGVGNGKYKRQLSDNHITAASHNEVGRLIEEHGFIGFIILLGLLIIPLINIWQEGNYQRAFCLAFYLLWFLTINHSAMRIAFPGFIYALSLIKITENEPAK